MSEPKLLAASHLPVRAQRLGELLEGRAEVDEEPAVRLALDDLLRLGVERRLLVIVDDELRHGAAAGLPRFLEDRGQRGPVAVVAGGDVDLRRLAEFFRKQMRPGPCPGCRPRRRAAIRARRAGLVELGERRVGPAGEHQHVVGDGHRRRQPRSSPRIEIADDHLHIVDVDELLRAFDARLRVALAVLRVGQLDLDAGRFSVPRALAMWSMPSRAASFQACPQRRDRR